MASFLEGRMRRIPIVPAALAAALVPPAPAGAVVIANADAEHQAVVSVDFWVRRVQPGESVVFHPASFPMDVYGQFPYATVTCPVGSDADEVALSGEGCRVNGQPAGDASFRF